MLRLPGIKDPPCSLIYCDPPYVGASGYGTKFDHLAFWEWCRHKTAEGHRVFVSEASAPDDFTCMWELDVNVYINNKNRKTAKITSRTERLFSLML